MRFETAAYPTGVQQGKEHEKKHGSTLTHSEILELFKFARVEHLRFFLDLVVLYEPLFELLPSGKPRDCRA